VGEPGDRGVGIGPSAFTESSSNDGWTDSARPVTPYVLLAVAFVVPFFDPRRPFRLLHADILVLALFPFYYLRYMDQSRGSLRWAVVVASIGLVYLFARMIFAAVRPTRHRGPLVPFVPMPLLAIAAVLLIALHIAFPRLEEPLGLQFRPVIDVGLSSVTGAQHILNGQELYGSEAYKHPGNHPDTYGPVTYLAYVPFTYALSPDGERAGRATADSRAARAAADAFDVLAALGLFLFGRRLAPRREGVRLGIVLAYAWAAYPYTFFATIWAYNDALVALFLVGAMLAISAPVGRGLLVGLGVASKFTTAIVAPLLATAHRATSIRSIFVYVAALVLSVVAVFAPFVPPGGLSELYDRTIGWQIARQSVSSVWGQFPSIDWLHPVARASVAVFALAIAFIPRQKTSHQIAALGAAAIVLFELSLRHWLPSYVIWFAPLAFVAIFATGSQAPLQRAREASE
jgi:hypothetical protein